MNTADRREHGTMWQLAVTHCRNGHEYTEENTYLNGGRRHCRECGRRRSLEYWQNNRDEVSRRQRGEASSHQTWRGAGEVSPKTSTVWHRECTNVAECGIRMEITVRDDAEVAQQIPEPTVGPATCPLCGGEWGEWSPTAAPEDEATSCDMHGEHIQPLSLGDGDYRCDECGVEWYEGWD